MEECGNTLWKNVGAGWIKLEEGVVNGCIKWGTGCINGDWKCEN